jgi:hypothetical protein
MPSLLREGEEDQIERNRRMIESMRVSLTDLRTLLPLLLRDNQVCRIFAKRCLIISMVGTTPLLELIRSVRWTESAAESNDTFLQRLPHVECMRRFARDLGLEILFLRCALFEKCV